MLVEGIAREPLVVDKDENIARAFELLERKKDTHIVVSDEGKVTGILSVKDMLRIVLDRMRWGQQRVGKLYVSAVMTPNPIFVAPNIRVDKAARLMIEKGISSLIVANSLDEVDEIKLITKRDFLQHWGDIFKGSEIVSDIMTRNPVVIHPGTSIKRAEWILREKKISTLPVIEEGMLSGYVDARLLALYIVRVYLKGDIKHFDVFLNETTVSDIMKPPHYVLETEPIESAVEKMLRKKAKGTPVLAGDKLTGIVTETDLTKLLAGEKI